MEHYHRALRNVDSFLHCCGLQDRSVETRCRLETEMNGTVSRADLTTGGAVTQISTGLLAFNVPSTAQAHTRTKLSQMQLFQWSYGENERLTPEGRLSEWVTMTNPDF